MWHPATTFDLHLHSTRSDGRHAPEEVLARCGRAGLDVVALTDHDLPPVFETHWEQVGDRRMLVVAAAELSGFHASPREGMPLPSPSPGSELHLLAYFPGVVPQEFRAFCRAQCVERARRYTVARERLPDGVAEPCPVAEAGDRALTRMHLARDLVKAGHARDVRETFARWLADAHGVVPPITIPFVDVIRFAREQGAFTSWAHPSVVQVDRWLPTFAAAGLQGLEGIRPMLTSDERRRLRKAAERHGMYVTGGSDWHGWGDDGDLGLFRVEAQQIGPFLSAFLPGGAPAAD